MKKIFKYLFILTIMFILPNFVLAEETDANFNHIDINKNVSLKYKVLNNEYSIPNLDATLSGIKLYKLDQNNNKVEITFTTDNISEVGDNYRISGEFPKYYDDGTTEVKYLVEYTYTATDIYTDLNSSTNKTITYSKEYSFNSEYNNSTDGGILINLQETNSFENITPMLTIRKQLEPNTPPGTFIFNIKNTSGTIIKTVSITIPEGSTSKEIYFESINVNTSYLVEEVPDSKNIYKLKSITSTKGDPTIVHDSNATTVRATSTEDVITVTAINESAVDHTKEAHSNGDGTYQLSLDVTGENETAVKKANVVIIMDTSNSMIQNNAPKSRTAYTYNYSTYDEGSYRYYTSRYGSERLYYRNNRWRTGNRDNSPVYQGTEVWAEVRNQPDVTRLAAEKEALYDMVEKLLRNNTQEVPDIIDISLVTFNLTAKGELYNSHNYTTLHDKISGVSTHSGTNWEDGLKKSIDYAERLKSDFPDEEVYVIFLTDGEPTARGANPSGYTTPDPNNNYEEDAYWKHWNAASDDAKRIAEEYHLYTIYTYGNPSTTDGRKFINFLDNLTHYAYGEGTYSSEADIGTGSDDNRSKYFFNATDTAELVKAFNEIIGQINTSGIGAVTISDGTTQSITTSAGVSNLLTVDESYEYWLTFNLSDDNKIKVNDTEVTVTKNGSNYTLSWTEGETNKSITAPAGSYIKDNTFVYKWTGSNDFYKVAPPEAKLQNGSVNWELSKEKVGLLLNDVKYTVTFNVWPSQYTYDLISDFDNGIENYNDSKYDEIRKYLILNDDGSYSLRTNTTAKLTYDDSRDEVGSRDTFFVNPEPVATGVSEVSLEKVWKNALDSRDADEIELYLTVDGEDYGEKDEFGNPLPYLLKKTDDPKTNWKKDIFISTGLISLDRTTGTATVREVGHEYGFREKPSDAYYWDLEVAIRRPMVINKANGELETVMLIKVPDNEITDTDEINTLNTKSYLVKDGKEYFRICYRDENGNDIASKCNIYRRATTNESNTISATNYRRSNLNVTKTVEGDYDPDTLFEFDLQVTDANGHDVWFSIWNGTGYVINDANHNYVTGATAEILVESDTIHNIVYDPTTGKVTYIENGEEKEITYIGEDSDGNPFTGFYFFRSGNTITVLMKAGWNLRFTNLPNGSTYIFDEVLDEEKYNFVEVKINEYRKATTDDPGVNRDTYNSTTNTLVNSKINEYNLSYTVTYTNTAVKADPVTARKIWKDEDNKYSSRPSSLKLNLLADGKLKDTQIVNASNNWNYTWENLAKYNAAGEEIVYTVTETAVNDGDLANYIPVLNGLTITNYYNLTNIKVSKDWNNTPSNKWASIIVKIKSSDDGQTYQAQKSLTSDNGWTETFNNVIKYIVVNGTPVPVDYVIEEMSIEGATLENGVFIDYNDTIHAIVGRWTSVVTGDMNSGYVITNTYDPITPKTIVLVKKSFNGNALEGAEFVLYKYIGNGESGATNINPSAPGANWLFMQRANSDSDGEFVFDGLYDANGNLILQGLYAGEYRLIETKAPTNCILPKGQWILFLELSNDESEVVINKDKSTSTDEAKTPALLIHKDGGSVDIEVYNEEIPDIPSTGGIGIPHNNKYGLLLMILGIGIYLYNLVNQRKQIKNFN